VALLLFALAVSRDAPVCKPRKVESGVRLLREYLSAGCTTEFIFGNEMSELERELLAACKTARRRFYEQNGDVSEQVWRENYPAIKTLSDVIAKEEAAIDESRLTGDRRARVRPHELDRRSFRERRQERREEKSYLDANRFSSDF